MESQSARSKGIALRSLRQARRQPTPRSASTIMGDSVKSDHARITVAIFWAKTRMGWKETTVLEHKDGDAEEQSLRDSIDSKFDRVAVTGTANGFSAEPE